MTTITTTPPNADVSASLLQMRDEAVAAWREADAKMTAAQETERANSPKSDKAKEAKAQRLSWGAKKANRRHEISQAELDLRLAGVEFEKFEEPAKTPTGTRLLPISQEEIESSLALVRQLMATLTDAEADVKHDCEIRIKRLLKQAEVRGYKVS